MRKFLQVIYIDTLFLLNATVDYLLLLASARVAGEPLVRIRFLLGACIGGAYAVLLFLFPFMESLWYKGAICLLILYVAYGRSRRLVRQGCIFFALSFAFAGGVLGISLMGQQGLHFQNGVFYSPMDFKIVILSSAFCYVLLTVVFHNFGRHSTLDGELVSVTMTLSDKEISFTSLIDTGNTLRDPVSGQSVMVVEGELVNPFFSKAVTSASLESPSQFIEEHRELGQRLRLLPYQAVGVQGLLTVLRVDSIQVGGERIRENLVALSPTPVSDGGNYHGLLSVQRERLPKMKKQECKI